MPLQAIRPMAVRIFLTRRGAQVSDDQAGAGRPRPFKTVNGMTCNERKSLRLFAWGIVILSATCAQGHPGHPPGEFGLGHLITSPYHLIVLAVLGACAFGLSRFVRHRAVARILR